MTDLIETMARAIWERPVGHKRVPWDLLDMEDQDVFRAYARAAFAAIEAAGYRVVPVEPTGEMVDSGTKATGNPHLRGDVECAYTAMLATAPKHGGPR